MKQTALAQESGARLCILSCANFHAEIQACLDAEAWADVVCAALPARCGRPALTWDEIGAAVPPGCTQVLLLGRACLGGLGAPPPGCVPTRVLVQEQCFHLIAGPTQVAEEINQGSYLVSPGWLGQWRQQLEKLGFAPDHAAEFFHDFTKGLTLLDTGIQADSTQHLQDLATALDLPARRVPVGLDHMRLFLKNLVLQWRLDAADVAAQERQRQHARLLSEHVSALDLLGQLTRQRQEAEVLAGMEDMFRMLFAPQGYHYLAAADDPVPGLPAGLRDVLVGLDQAYAWTPSQQGFVLRLLGTQQPLGFVVVDGLQFPQFKEQYLNLALSLRDVCALAIESARNRKRLIEAEKMASLGAMVAGIAHEINTPVGVGVLAASTLQHQTRDLAAAFAERRMTQTDLRNYLEASRAGTDLIASSLERVGKLIASFRRVSIQGHRQTLQSLTVATSLQDTITSFGERLQKGPYRISVDCAPNIVVQGYPGDLESVFTNLIANSLQHGFKGRAEGSIQIRVEQQATGLRMVYADDGKGLSAEASQRIFDPFFTTDMQSGMGLGMHLVYNLITQRMGGSIRVDPQHGQGARFLIEVPTQTV
ncbi:MAG: DUF1638 domain-containing protein [Rhodoferax sp.]|nr:DUF1638 domain-containing protein [Rhodoferax sp.]